MRDWRFGKWSGVVTKATSGWEQRCRYSVDCFPGSSLLDVVAPTLGVAGAPFALIGLMLYENAYVQAGQSVPLAYPKRLNCLRRVASPECRPAFKAGRVGEMFASRSDT